MSLREVNFLENGAGRGLVAFVDVQTVLHPRSAWRVDFKTAMGRIHAAMTARIIKMSRSFATETLGIRGGCSASSYSGFIVDALCMNLELTGDSLTGRPDQQRCC